MFSGIVEEVGQISLLNETGDGAKLKIAARQVLDGIKQGDSISVDGICLTVTEFDDASFSVEAVKETLRRTKLGQKKQGARVNLERALKLSDRLGGHLVTGHIDAVAKVAKIEEDGFSSVITFELPRQWQSFFVEKGSVAVDGVSLTVVEVRPITEDSPQSKEPFWFTVALIPHTLSVTTLGTLKAGDSVNIETDVVARYVARWLEPHLGENLKKVTASIQGILK